MVPPAAKEPAVAEKPAAVAAEEPAVAAPTTPAKAPTDAPSKPEILPSPAAAATTPSGPAAPKVGSAGQGCLPVVFVSWKEHLEQVGVLKEACSSHALSPVHVQADTALLRPATPPLQKKKRNPIHKIQKVPG